jgi:predicted Zn-dependent protease
MLRFTGKDDELAVVVAHEIAHNAMGHIDAKKKNATLGQSSGPS